MGFSTDVEVVFGVRDSNDYGGSYDAKQEKLGDRRGREAGSEHAELEQGAIPELSPEGLLAFLVTHDQIFG